MSKMFQRLVFSALVLMVVFSFNFAFAAGNASVAFNLKADLKKVESDGLIIDITKISVPFSFFFMGEKKELANELKAIPTPIPNFKVNKDIISKIKAQGHSSNPILSALGAEINFSEVTMADEIKDIRGKYHSDKSFSDILFWLKRDSQKFEISDGYIVKKINSDVTIYSSGVKNVNCWKNDLSAAFNQARINSGKIKKIIRNFKSANFNDIKEGDKIKKITGQCFKNGDYEISECSVLDKSLPDNYCRGADKTREDCGNIRSWSCVDNQCQKARCGDGVCNDDGFSPAAESGGCSQDCGGGAGSGSGDNGSNGDSDSGSGGSNSCTNITNNIAITKNSYTGNLDSNNSGMGYSEADDICGMECGSSYHTCKNSELLSLDKASCSSVSKDTHIWMINIGDNYPKVNCSNWTSSEFANTGDESAMGLVAICEPGTRLWHYIAYDGTPNSLAGDSCHTQNPFFCCSDNSSNSDNNNGVAGSCANASSCGGSSQWSCVNGKCQAAKCGDGFCNDCSNSFSPCVPSETSENCSQDCSEKSIKQDDKDYLTRGYTVGYKAFWDVNESNKDQGIDYCATIKDGSVGSHKVSAGPYLVEFYKDAQGFAAFEVVKCENGCKDGACQ